ncbi:MAG: excinuclease ABC subunit UvrA, partial [Planctomycetota bacterium]
MTSRRGRPLVVRGAAENNLRAIDIEIPRDRFVVVTGISGSGKSTLAHGIICREGQRRFVESLSPYARQYLGRLDRPKVETIEGLSPTISIDQKTISRNPRSTVGTITEILDMLRLLYSRLGVPHCPNCGETIEGRSRDQIVSHAWDHHQGQEVLVCSPIVLERKGEYRKEIEELRNQGFARVRIDGELIRLSEEIVLARYERHTIEVVLDKLRLQEGKRGRFAESVEKALSISDGLVNVVCKEDSRIFSSRFGCLSCAVSFPEMEPRLFSFNSPQGACTRCAGLGKRRSPTEQTVVKNPKLSIEDGGLILRRQGKVIRGISVAWEDLVKVALAERISLERPWNKLSERARRLLLEGSRAVGASSDWPGFITLIEEAYDLEGGRELERVMPWSVCGDCDGSRLHPLPRAVKYRGMGIDQICAMTVLEARQFFAELELDEQELRIGQSLYPEIES